MDPINAPGMMPAVYVRPVEGGLPAGGSAPAGDAPMAGDAAQVALPPAASAGARTLDLNALDVPELIEVTDQRPGQTGPSTPTRPPRPQPTPPAPGYTQA